MLKKAIILLPLIFVLSISSQASAKERISVSGAWALYPLMTIWAEEYQKVNPNVIIDVSAGGAGKGATDTLAGMVDIGMISREAQKDELDKGGFFIPVAKDAVVPVVSNKNPVLADLKQKGVTRDTFARMWLKNDIANWGMVVGTSNNKPLRVYTRADSCGAAESWAKFFDSKQEKLKGTAVYGDPGLLEAVKKDPLGIGYNNYSYVFDLKTGKMIDGVFVVPIDVNKNGKVDSNEVIDTREKLQTAIKTGVYPHPPARPLYLMTKGKPKGTVANFISWILTDGQKMVEGAGYMKIPSETIKSSLEKLKNGK